MRIVLVLATLTFGLGVVQKSPCVVPVWSQAASPAPMSHMCYSDISILYVHRGLGRGHPAVPAAERPAGGPAATLAAGGERPHPRVPGAHRASGWGPRRSSPTRSARHRTCPSTPRDAISGDARVQYDSALFWAVNAVGFFCVLLIGLAFLVRAQRRRPWDAAMIAAVAGARTDRDDQLGCAGAGLRRRLHLGVVDPSPGHGRHLHRTRRRDEVLPAVLPRPAADLVPARAADWRPGSRPSSRR